MSNCISYSHNNREYLLPPINIFKRYCSPKDKTNIFLVSVIRTIVWFSINRIWGNMIPTKGKMHYLKSILYWMLIVNIIFLIIITLHSTQIVIDPPPRILDDKNDLAAT